MMAEKALFNEQIAPHYEAWYETPKEILDEIVDLDR
jgi:hypothetical protein